MSDVQPARARVPHRGQIRARTKAGTSRGTRGTVPASSMVQNFSNPMNLTSDWGQGHFGNSAASRSQHAAASRSSPSASSLELCTKFTRAKPNLLAGPWRVSETSTGGEPEPSTSVCLQQFVMIHAYSMCPGNTSMSQGRAVSSGTVCDHHRSLLDPGTRRPWVSVRIHRKPWP